jgi:hypothetical protein
MIGLKKTTRGIMTKYIAKIAAYDYPVGTIITKGVCNCFNPDLTWFNWPDNKGGLWLEKHEYQKIEK